MTEYSALLWGLFFYALLGQLCGLADDGSVILLANADQVAAGLAVVHIKVRGLDAVVVPAGSKLAAFVQHVVGAQSAVVQIGQGQDLAVGQGQVLAILDHIGQRNGKAGLLGLVGQNGGRASGVKLKGGAQVFPGFAFQTQISPGQLQGAGALHTVALIAADLHHAGIRQNADTVVAGGTRSLDDQRVGIRHIQSAGEHAVRIGILGGNGLAGQHLRGNDDALIVLLAVQEHIVAGGVVKEVGVHAQVVPAHDILAAFIDQTVGTHFEPQVRKVRTKNPTYWDIENVHITKITSTYNKEAAAVSPDLYLRGEITSLDVPSSLLQDWMNDPEKKDMIRPSSLSFYSYFYCLNFDPHFSEDYEPENWKKAVNTTSFRRCLFYALDRHGALMTVDPYDPDHIIINTFTPPDFVAMDGSDFVNIGGMAKYTNDENNLFNPDLALELKEQAVADLTAKGVTFPIKILMPYNGGATWGNRCQVIKQQMESLLGSDFIEVCFEAYSSSFLDSTRRCGNYAMQECNEEATFADPDTFSMMFDEDNNFSFFYACEEVDENGKNLFDVYMEKLNYAKSQTTDLSERYKAFADAEAYLLDNAIAIPFGLGVLGAGYTSSHTNPFEGAWSPLGVSNERYKYSYVYNETMNSEQYYKLQEQWEKDKIAALQAAGQ